MAGQPAARTHAATRAACRRVAIGHEQHGVARRDRRHRLREPRRGRSSPSPRATVRPRGCVRQPLRSPVGPAARARVLRRWPGTPRCATAAKGRPASRPRAARTAWRSTASGAGQACVTRSAAPARSSVGLRFAGRERDVGQHRVAGRLASQRAQGERAARLRPGARLPLAAEGLHADHRADDVAVHVDVAGARSRPTRKSMVESRRLWMPKVRP